MGRTVVLLALMVTAVLIASGLALAQAVPGGHTVPLQTQLPTGEAIPDEYIVVLEDQPTSAGLEARATDAAQRMASRYAGLKVKQTYGHALVGFAARIPEERLDEVKADPGVLFVSENREVSADFRQVLPEGVDRIEADKSSAMAGNGRGSVGVGIAVLDSGVDRSHPDLNVAADGKDCSGSPNGPFDDPFGHGTHVAGTAAAKDNAFGVVGVAPGAPIYSVRVLDEDGSGNTASTICGIDWVTAHSGKIEVANMSLGGFGRDDESCGTENRNAEHYAICRSVEEGVTYVASAGNDDRNFRTQGPASYDEVLTVTAMADNDGKPGGDDRFRCYPRRFPASRDDAAAPFSNFTTVGSDDAGHTIAAPGVCVLSTVPGNSYDVFSGTSMASPHVAGTAALYEAARRDPSPRQVMEALRAEAREQPPSYGFEGDPSRPIDRRYYGYLVHTGGF